MTAGAGNDDGAATQDAFPRVFGAYTLLALLGKGGMGEVFLAARTGIEGISRRCVVKTLRPGFGDDREYVSRFLDEARVVSQLHHRNICPVFDVGKEGERHYLAMEYIAGRDLKSVADRAAAAGAPLTLPVSLHIVAEVLEALDYAHSLSDPSTDEPLLLVHRDVSPHNVMVGFDGDVRLIDFGLAASTLKVEQTAPNVVMGKVNYMAPEHICGEVIDARADQYAAAVMATELLIGSRFYEGRSTREVYPVAAPGGFRPRAFHALPAALRAILDRALAARADDRFPSCGALREALDAWRFEHHPGREAPALRQLMRAVFVDDIAADRALLSRVAVEAGLPRHHVLTASVPSLVARVEDTTRQPAEPTERADLAPDDATRGTQSAPAALAPPPFARMPTASTTVPTRSAAGPAPPTTTTATTTATTTTKRSALLAAVVGVGAAALVVIAVLALADPPAATTTPVTAAPTTSPLASTTTILVPAPPLTPIAPEVRPTPPPATTTKPTTTKPPTPTTPATTTKKPSPPSTSAPPGQRLRWVLEHCAPLSCAGPLRARKADWAKLEGDAQAAFQDDLRACFLRCTR